jgi:DNA-binding XRE family transcriptional regulator
MAAINELHEIIHFHRKQARLSRMELADLAGVGKTVIYDLEKGKETVKWSTVQSVLTALNVKIRFESPLTPNYEKSSG